MAWSWIDGSFRFLLKKVIAMKNVLKPQNAAGACLALCAALLFSPAAQAGPAYTDTVIVDDFSSWSPVPGNQFDSNILPIPGSYNFRQYGNAGVSAEKTGAGSIAIDYGVYYHPTGTSGGKCCGGVLLSYSMNAADLSGFTGLQVTGSGQFTAYGNGNLMGMSISLLGGRDGSWSPRWDFKQTNLYGDYGNFVLDFSQKPANFYLTNVYEIQVSFGWEWGYGYNAGPPVYNAGTYDLKDIRLLGSLPVNGVPTPGTLPLLGAAAAAALVVGPRRRRRAEKTKG
jgi:hypothetical protein